MTSYVWTANELVPITSVCVWIGMAVPPDCPYDRPSPKLRCPFGFLHEDYGVEAAFRFYQHTKSAYCFAGCGYYRPVALFAAANDMDEESAAIELLRRIDWVPPTPDARWAEAAPKEKVDQGKLEESFKVYLSRRLDNWPDCQYDYTIARFLSRCLGLLQLVETREQADLWLSSTKQAADQLAKRLQATVDSETGSGDNVRDTGVQETRGLPDLAGSRSSYGRDPAGSGEAPQGP